MACAGYAESLVWLRAWLQARAPSRARSGAARRSSARRCPSTPTPTASSTLVSTSRAPSASSPVRSPVCSRWDASFFATDDLGPDCLLVPHHAGDSGDDSSLKPFLSDILGLDFRIFRVLRVKKRVSETLCRVRGARERDGGGADGLPAADHDAPRRARGVHHEAHHAGPRACCGPFVAASFKHQIHHVTLRNLNGTCRQGRAAALPCPSSTSLEQGNCIGGRVMYELTAFGSFAARVSGVLGSDANVAPVLGLWWLHEEHATC